MRRKKVDRLEGVPAELAWFDAAKWGSFDAWKAARSEWASLHDWPGGVLARILEEREVRFKLRGYGPPEHRSVAGIVSG